MAAASGAPSKKILIIVTNWDKLGDTGKKTGWYLPEVAHPFEVFTKAGFAVDFASVDGGLAPVDPGSVEAFAKDDVCTAFLANEEASAALKATQKIADVSASDYSAVCVAGGHGPMWDLPGSDDHNGLVGRAYEGGAVVSAVCHGTVGLLNVKLSDGKHLIDGRKVTSFSDAEEDAVSLTEVMPFALETELKARGAEYSKAAEDWGCHVVVDGRIVTGQNPASATAMAEAVVKALAA